MKSRDTTPTATPHAAQADGAEVCFEVAQVLDGFVSRKRSETLDGMRGEISTDTHFGVASLWQLSRPRKLGVAKGTPLLRVLPVPRHLLRATFQTV